MTPDLRERLREQWRALTRMQAELSRTIAEADSRGDYKLDHYTSMRAWLRGELHMTTTEAAQRVCVARQVREVPELAVIFASGDLPYPHVALLSRTRVGLGDTAFRDVLPTLLKTAATADGTSFREHVRRTRQSHGSPRPGVAPHQPGQARVALRHHEDGTWSLHGRLDNDSGKVISAALNRTMLTPTGPTPEPTDERRADALTALCSKEIERRNHGLHEHWYDRPRPGDRFWSYAHLPTSTRPLDSPGKPTSSPAPRPEHAPAAHEPATEHTAIPTPRQDSPEAPTQYLPPQFTLTTPTIEVRLHRWTT
ncbi:hypothetical protein JOF53_006033 [Crossiella equi]|uniref:DUF222 domain-containing protein n=1 Tax=Crossiella equi TaxID=130796 RepID=A0ABS5AKR9_9PSEU|nr:DUF222 domain-containing protein [Crossiella equi]MBP2477161.1 hypothetical protein [Crossiella equi]